jgi:hypothetical protein
MSFSNRVRQQKGLYQINGFFFLRRANKWDVVHLLRSLCMSRGGITNTEVCCFVFGGYSSKKNILIYLEIYEIEENKNK